MAKLTAPLLSFDARGKLGDTLVFMGWKGIKTVRQFVIPANPNSAAQQTARARMTNLNAVWHVLDTDDIAAWNDWAPYEPKPMSGFNAACKAGVAALVASAANFLANTVESTPAETTLDIVAELVKISDRTAVTAEANIVAKWGTSPRTLSNSQALAWDGGDSRYEGQIAGLTGSTTYYVRIYDSAQDLYLSGLFAFATSAP